jgi:hypothetical protein
LRRAIVELENRVLNDDFMPQIGKGVQKSNEEANTVVLHARSAICNICFLFIKQYLYYKFFIIPEYIIKNKKVPSLINEKKKGIFENKKSKFTCSIF